MSRERLELYDRSLGKVEDAAESAAARGYRAWRSANADSSVAEVRKGVKALAESALSVYGDAAGKLAADFYDEVAESAGADVAPAELPEVGEGALGAIDRGARYLVGALDGDDDGGGSGVGGTEGEVARGVGRLVREQVARRANETVISNVGRDRKHGARFARVPMGGETCSFCVMLASRGFVYHSKATAGEFDHFHRSCRCKVVPGFPEMEFYYENGTKVSRGLAPSVEGYDPDLYFDMWKHPEKYEAGTTSRISSGVGMASNKELEAWASKFENEKLDVTRGDASVLSRTGTPLGVSVSSDEVALLDGCHARHTHTTTVGGTFSSDDIDLTVDGWLESHEVEATYTGDVFRLERTDSATKESADEFKNRFREKEEEYHGEFLYEEWEKNCAALEIPAGIQEEIASASRVKEAMHQWLLENAESYGYKYSQIR